MWSAMIVRRSLASMLGERSTAFLVTLAGDETIREYALRALTDRDDARKGIPAEPILGALRDPQPRIRRAR